MLDYISRRNLILRNNNKTKRSNAKKIYHNSMKTITLNVVHEAVVDPGFSVGGAWTPEAVTFRKFYMSKRKNLDPWGGACAGHLSM